MVADESEVLPTAAALGPDDGDPAAFDDELARVAVPRPSRPSLDHGWEEEDHYHTANADAPADAYDHGAWKEVYHDLDEIMVNGALKLHWQRGMLEVQQIFERVKHVIGRDDVRREDLTLYFFGAQSPLAILFMDRLGLKHREFLLFVATCLRLSANNWTVTSEGTTSRGRRRSMGTRAARPSSSGTPWGSQG